MADARWLIVAAALAATSVRAATPCGDEERALGLRVGVQTGQLIVDAVTPDTLAASVVRAGDVVTQANATVVHGCNDWARAVRDARTDRKALLLLVDRGGTPTVVMVPASVWGVVTPPASREPGIVNKPSFPAPPPPPPPLDDSVVVSYDSIRADLDGLVPADHPPTSLHDYRRAVSQLRRALATLSARKAAPQDAINALRVALRPFEAAEVAWDGIEGERDRERRMRKVPMADEATVPFFEDSPAAAVMDEFPFLRATVARDPEPGILETAGQWRPVQARQLLWDHARTQLQALPSHR